MTAYYDQKTGEGSISFGTYRGLITLENPEVSILCKTKNDPLIQKPGMPTGDFPRPLFDECDSRVSNVEHSISGSFPYGGEKKFQMDRLNPITIQFGISNDGKFLVL